MVFNASKTQFLHMTTRRGDLPLDYNLFFDNTKLEPSPNLNILGVSFSPNLSWKEHIVSLAKSASRRLGVLGRLREFYTPSQLLSVYKGQVRPCMEYASHIWGGSSHTRMLDRVESRAMRLINSRPLTDSLQSVSDRRQVASLSLYYRYYNNHCSAEVAQRVPPPMRRARGTRQSSQSHPYSVQLFNPRLDLYRHSFMHSASVLWNSLPHTLFPDSYDLNSFKRRVAGNFNVP